MPPAFTFLSVAIEEMLNPVEIELICATAMMPRVASRPACPTIIGSLRYMITPRMDRMEGVKTPPKVPNLFDLAIGFENMIFCSNEKYA